MIFNTRLKNVLTSLILRQLLVRDYENEQFYLKKGLKNRNFEQLIGTLASHFIATHYGGLAMNPIDFIYTNIQKQLITEGFTVGIANLVARYGVDEYKKRSQPTRRGNIYAGCLHEARLQAKAHKKLGH